MTWVNDDNAALLTDLYELTMAASYHSQGLEVQATFDLFVRQLPERRNFLIAAGLEDALRYLENLRFSPDSIAYLRSLDLFDGSFLEMLADLRFTGDVWAIPEGEAVFAEEPLLRVDGPIIETQIVEAFLINCIAFQTMIASKAARVSLACGPRRFVDFSLRRDHGADAAMKAARATFIGGAEGTSNVLAGKEYGIPVRGTMAHSYVLAFGREEDAFRAFARDFPDRAIFLIDTYDTVRGAERVVAVAKELGITPAGVRLDSGDLAALSKQVRVVLDEAGFETTEIIASGDLDEYRIADLMGADAPVDAFGVGTQLGVSADEPSLGMVYKLVCSGDEPVVKLSTGKKTLPGRKQIHRIDDGHGLLKGDVMALEGERIEGGRALLEKVMEAGRRTGTTPALPEIQRRCAGTLESLPEGARSLTERFRYPVDRSPRLTEMIERFEPR